MSLLNALTIETATLKKPVLRQQEQPKNINQCQFPTRFLGIKNRPTFCKEVYFLYPKLKIINDYTRKNELQKS